MQDFISLYESSLLYFAHSVVITLELIGILIIVIGTIKAVGLIISNLIIKKSVNIVIDLGKSLALALEFKMGAEIVNTVIIRDFRELGVLAIVIALRALLALLIHWEIVVELREDEKKKKASKKDEE